MNTRLLTVAAMLWLFGYVPFFVLGYELLDPSQEYDAERQFWLSAVQWTALVGPPLMLGIGTRFFRSKSH